MNVSFPCKNCTERKLGCHSTCERYLVAREKHRQLHKQEQEDRVLESFDRKMYKRMSSHYGDSRRN